jgi:acyl transferase domain-containing protein
VKRPLIFMFSGQGSQYFQMGKELYGQNAVFRRVVERGDALVKQQLGRSLIAEIYGRPRSDSFDDLTLSHPALLVIEYATYQALLSEGIRPDQVWGSSLGELIAAVAADVWSFETALQITMEQARLVTATCRRGGMLAILSEFDLYAELKNSGHDIVLAGINFKKHFTISADVPTLQELEAQLTRRGIAFQRLPVGYAFHSAAIEAVQQPFIRFCAALPMNCSPRVPFLSGATGDYIHEVTPEYIWSVVRGPMRFSEAIQRLESRGPSAFVDCGPSSTSATFVKYNLSEHSGSICLPILTPFHQGVQKLAQVKEYVAKNI